MPASDYLVKVVTYGFKCKRCGHTWIPRPTRRKSKADRNPDALPVLCPNCGSGRWNKD